MSQGEFKKPDFFDKAITKMMRLKWQHWAMIAAGIMLVIIWAAGGIMMVAAVLILMAITAVLAMSYVKKKEAK